MNNRFIEERLKSLEVSLVRAETAAIKRESAIIDALSQSMRINMNLLLTIAAVADKDDRQLKEYSEQTIGALNEMSDKIGELLKEKSKHVDQIEKKLSRFTGEENE